jgi:hypothetical protein
MRPCLQVLSKKWSSWRIAPSKINGRTPVSHDYTLAGHRPSPRRAGTWALCSRLAALALLLGLAVVLGWRLHPQAHPATVADLLRLPLSRLSEAPIAELNLLCASGLCATNEPDLRTCTATLGVWAERVRSQTERHLYRYQRNPAEFEQSPGFFRMLMLAVVLAEDYGIHYDAARMAGPESTRVDDGFFANPRSVFLHGLLGPERAGTCSSLPVLYVAVGRRLGYPLKLVTTKGHLFVRWEGAGERFNVEATGHGLNRFDDEYYRHWPFEISAADERAEGYLKSLTPAGELAAFLSVRGMCFHEAGRLSEAAESFGMAVRLAPDCHSYRTALARLQRNLAQRPLSPVSLPETTGRAAHERNL